ncbi:hypothetical protein J6590_106165, partial [Homalodisca vitripennis]
MPTPLLSLELCATLLYLPVVDLTNLRDHQNNNLHSQELGKAQILKKFTLPTKDRMFTMLRFQIKKMPVS